MDVVEIGSRTLEQGGVYPVKPLGVFAMIDDGELDWKVLPAAAADGELIVVKPVELSGLGRVPQASSHSVSMAAGQMR